MNTPYILNIFHYIRKNLQSPEGFFLIVGSLFIFFFAVFIPPFQGLDEPTHFFRIIQVGEGHFIPRHIATQNGLERFGDIFPQSLVTEVDQLRDGTNQVTGKYDTGLIKTYLTKPNNNKSAEIEGFEGSELYSPVSYIPQVLGYKVSRIVTASPLLRMYAARLANGLAYLLLVWLAIRLIPFGKWTLAAVALLPDMVFSAGTLQADPFLFGLIAVFVASILYLKDRDKALTLVEVFLLGCLMIGIALTKSGYFPVLLILFVLPKRLWPKPWISRSLAIGIPLILAFSWSYGVRSIANVLRRVTSTPVSYTPADQIHHLVSHPLSFVIALVSTTFSGSFDIMFRQLFGTFTWSQLQLPILIQVFSLSGILVALVFQLGRHKPLSVSSKVITAITLVALYSYVFFSLYILWYAPGALSITIQGRYLIPLFILLIPMFTGKTKILQIKERSLTAYVQLTSITTLVTTAIILIDHFY